MRAGYTAFLSLEVIFFLSKNYVPIQERGKNLRSNLGSNLGLTGHSKKGLFCVRKQGGIYGINTLFECFLFVAVKQAMPVRVLCVYREYSQFPGKYSVDFIWIPGLSQCYVESRETYYCSTFETVLIL